MTPAMRLESSVRVLALVLLVASAAGAAPTGLECVIHEWAVSPGVWSGSGDTDPTPLLMTATTRWKFQLEGCSLTSGTCDVFGSGSRTFQNGSERPEWYPTNTQPTITNPSGNTVVYDFSMRDAFVPISGQPRFEDMDWTLTAELPAAPSDSPSAAELAAATSLAVSITHAVDNTFFVISWSGTATETVFTSCTPVVAGLSVNDVTQAEGSGGGSSSFVFTVSRGHNADAVSVVAQTMDGTAEAGSDYTAVGPVTVNFAAGGGLTQTVAVTVSADDEVESDESFTLELSSPTNATLVDGVGDGTILNDDAFAELTIDDVTAAEGSGGGSTDFVFTVSRSHNLQAASVSAQTVDGTAGAPSDFTAVGPLTVDFPAAGVLTKTVTVAVEADDTVELDEDFSVQLSAPSNATIGDGVGDGMITNDDAASLSIDSGSQIEGSGGGTVPYTFTVTLDGPVDTTVSVDFDTRDDTAEDEAGDGDYTSAQGTLQFSGNPTDLVMVDIAADDRPEQDESFFVDLSNVLAGGRDVSIGVAEGVATLIDDDDACPGLIIYQQPFDSPSTLTGHPATTGADPTFENVVDGAGAVTTLPAGPVSRIRLWGFGDDGGGNCALDPAVPFDLVFAADAAGIPGAVVAQRSGLLGSLSDAGSGLSRIDLEFDPFEAGSVSWISVQRAEDAGCAFQWLAEPLAGTYDDEVFTPPGPAPDDAYFCVGHPLIFSDGFESGDTAAWSNTVP